MSDTENVNAPRVYRLGDLLGEWDTFAQERHAAREGNKPLGIRTSIDAVDDAIGGVFQPGLHAVQGGPGVGKTAFALQIATTCAQPALFVTCEMAPLELLRRITSHFTGVFLSKFKTGELTPEFAGKKVREAIASCPDLAILDCTRGYVPAFGYTNGGPNLYDFAAALRGDAPHFLLVLDSLHTWADAASDSQNLKEYDYLNLAIGSLRGLSASLDCPILAVVERNRAGMAKGGLSAGAGTRKIEYSAETMIELDAKDGGPNADGSTDVELRLSKNRNGLVGRPVALKFNGATMRFREAV